MVVFVVKLKAVAVQMDRSHVLHTMVNLSLQLVMVEQHWIYPGWLTVSVKIQAEDTSLYFFDFTPFDFTPDHIWYLCNA